MESRGEFLVGIVGRGCAIFMWIRVSVMDWDFFILSEFSMWIVKRILKILWAAFGGACEVIHSWGILFYTILEFRGVQVCVAAWYRFPGKPGVPRELVPVPMVYAGTPGTPGTPGTLRCLKTSLSWDITYMTIKNCWISWVNPSSVSKRFCYV